jgi:tetratricopeptide (TPR) repeat protein
MEDLRLPALLSPMTSIRFLNCLRSLATGVLMTGIATSQLMGQTAPAGKPVDKAAAYYHYTLGHMYAEQAGNKGDFLNKAIENLRLALKADPDAGFISEELSDLYVQSGRLREAAQDAEEALRTNPSDVNARRILGRIYTRMIGDSQQGKVDENMLRKAIEQYTKIVEIQPKDLDTWLMLGRLHKIAQNSVEAEKAYKKILEVDPNHEDALTGLAVVYADLGDSQRSSELLKRLTDKNPSPRTLMALASQYEQLKDYGLAAETLRRALELQPENLELKRAYAQNLLLAERLDEALRAFNEIAEQDKKDWQSQLRISQIYRQKKDFVKAREASNKALNLEPKNLEVQYNEVNILEAEGKPAEATTALKDLLAGTAKRTYSSGEKSNRALLLERLGLMYRSAEQFPDAIATFRQIADLDATLAPRAAAQVIDTYRIAKDFDKAVQEADAAVKKFPEDRMLISVRASILAEVGRSDDAAAEVKKLLDGKNDRETYISLAQIYEKGKNFTEMAKAVDAADKLSESKDDKESISFMRGAMYEKMKKFDAAEGEFRKVLELNPKNSSALNYLGYMLADRNVRLSDALNYIKQAVELEPNNGAYLDSLGWAYYRAGDLPKAEEYLRRAIERFSKDPTVHDHLGDVYFKQGNLKDAITHWQLSLKEWESASPSERDTNEVAKVQKKLDSAKVRLARESGERGAPKQQ